MNAFSYTRRLHWSECDPAGIVYFPHYATWAVEGFNEFLLSHGVEANETLADGSVMGAPCVRFEMNFFTPIKLHQMVTHTISVERLGSSSISLRHKYSVNETPSAEAFEVRVWAIHRPDGGVEKTRIPDSAREVLQSIAA